MCIYLHLTGQTQRNNMIMLDDDDGMTKIMLCCVYTKYMYCSYCVCSLLYFAARMMLVLIGRGNCIYTHSVCVLRVHTNMLRFIFGGTFMLHQTEVIDGLMTNTKPLE